VEGAGQGEESGVREQSQSGDGGVDVEAGGEGDSDDERDEFLAGDGEFHADSIGAEWAGRSEEADNDRVTLSVFAVS
jgi:hypothetical protein